MTDQLTSSQLWALQRGGISGAVAGAAVSGSTGGNLASSNFENPGVPPPEAVKVKKVRLPAPKFNPEDLLGDRGLSKILEIFPKIKFRGKGHEASDIRQLMKVYRVWGYSLFKHMTFDELVEKIEKFGGTIMLKEHMANLRDKRDMEEFEPAEAKMDVDYGESGDIPPVQSASSSIAQSNVDAQMEYMPEEFEQDIFGPHTVPSQPAPSQSAPSQSAIIPKPAPSQSAPSQSVIPKPKAALSQAAAKNGGGGASSLTDDQRARIAANVERARKLRDARVRRQRESEEEAKNSELQRKSDKEIASGISVLSLRKFNLWLDKTAKAEEAEESAEKFMKLFTDLKTPGMISMAEWHFTWAKLDQGHLDRFIARFRAIAQDCGALPARLAALSQSVATGDELDSVARRKWLTRVFRFIASEGVEMTQPSQSQDIPSDSSKPSEEAKNVEENENGTSGNIENALSSDQNSSSPSENDVASPSENKQNPNPTSSEPGPDSESIVVEDESTIFPEDHQSGPKISIKSTDLADNFSESTESHPTEYERPVVPAPSNAASSPLIRASERGVLPDESSILDLTLPTARARSGSNQATQALEEKIGADRNSECSDSTEMDRQQLGCHSRQDTHMSATESQVAMAGTESQDLVFMSMGDSASQIAIAGSGPQMAMSMSGSESQMAMSMTDSQSQLAMPTTGSESQMDMSVDLDDASICALPPNTQVLSLMGDDITEPVGSEKSDGIGLDGPGLESEDGSISSLMTANFSTRAQDGSHISGSSVLDDQEISFSDSGTTHEESQSQTVSAGGDSSSATSVPTEDNPTSTSSVQHSVSESESPNGTDSSSVVNDEKM
eukprot:829266_1